MVAVDDGFLPVQAIRGRANDNVTVKTSVFTTKMTTNDHGSTLVSDVLVTTKVTATSTSSTSSSSSSTRASSSTEPSSSSLSSSRSENSSSQPTTSASSSTVTSALSSTSGVSSTSSSSSAAASLTSLPSVAAPASLTGSAAAKATSSNSSSLASTSSSKSLSTGAIIGICAGGGALLVLIIIFFIRKRFLHRRERRVNDWITPNIDLLGEGSLEKGGGAVLIDTFAPEREPSTRKEPVLPPLTRVPYTQPQLVRQYATAAPNQMVPPGGIAPGQVIPPVVSARAYNTVVPPTGYNDPPPTMFQNPDAVAQYNTPSSANVYDSHNYVGAAMGSQHSDSPAMGNYAMAAVTVPQRTGSIARSIPASLTPSQSSTGSVAFALVCQAFLPNLPDELAVNQGEMIRVLAEYDDGWALCANMRGEQGVVPQECLQRQRGNVRGSVTAARSRDDRLAFVSAG